MNTKARMLIEKKNKTTSAPRIVQQNQVFAGVSPTQAPSSCYIYGIASIGKQLVLQKDLPAIDQFSKVYTIPYRDICAIVSRVRYQEYDPTDENVLVHNGVLEEFHREQGGTILPLRFSTIGKTEQDVLKILANGYYKFKTKLAELRGKVEMALKVYCDRKAFANAIMVENKVGNNNSNALESAMRKRSIALASSILNQLKAVAVSHVLNEIIFEDTILDATFLLDKGRQKDFLARIKALNAKHAKYLRFESSGPYLPYSFTEPPEQ